MSMCFTCGIRPPFDAVLCPHCWCEVTEPSREALLYLREDPDISAEDLRQWLGGRLGLLAVAYAAHNPVYPLWLLEDPGLAAFFRGMERTS